MRDGAGAKAMSWLLKTAKHEELDATYSFTFIQATALCIVGEDKIDFWWEMLTIDHAPKSLNHNAISELDYSRMRWQNALVVALLEAQLFWTKEDSCFDAPLRTFDKIARLNTGKFRPEDRISIVSGLSWLRTRLLFSNKSNTKVSYYDDFIDFLRMYSKGHVDAQYNIGLLELMHPVNRRADTLLSFLHKAETHRGGRMERLVSIAPATLTMVFAALVRHCHNLGLAADVRWAIDFHRTVQQETTRLRGPGVKGRDLKRKFPRKATRSELARGVKIDADGRLESYNFRETSEETQEREKKLASKLRSPLEQPLHSSRAAPDTNSEQKKKAPVREGSVTYRPSF